MSNVNTRIEKRIKNTKKILSRNNVPEVNAILKSNNQIKKEKEEEEKARAARREELTKARELGLVFMIYE